MATINLGAIKFNWKGAYNNGTTYAVDDVVSSGGNSYVCIQASTGNAVGNATAYWNIMSTKGTNGTDGSNGTNGTDLTSTLSTRGDIVYKGASALTRLPKGTSGQVLGQGANDPTWVNGSSSTLTTQGDILYRDGSGLQRLAKGTASQELRMNSGATSPEWHTPAVASSDYVKIGAQFINNVSYFDYNSVFSTTYKFHRIILQGMKTHSNSDKIVFQYRKANGTIRTSNYQWNFHDLRSMYNGSHENSKYYGHTSQSYIPLQHVTSRTTGNYESCYYDLTIMNHGNGSSTGNGAMYFNNIVYSGGAGAFCQIRGGGFNESMNNDNYDGFRLKTVGGNGFSGALTVYGIK